MQLILYKLHFNYRRDMNLMLKHIFVMSSGMSTLICVGKTVMSPNFTSVSILVAKELDLLLSIMATNTIY